MFHLKTNYSKLLTLNNLQNKYFHKTILNNNNNISNNLSTTNKTDFKKNKKSLSLLILAQRNFNFFTSKSLNIKATNNKLFLNSAKLSFSKISKKNFSSAAESAEDEILLNQAEGLLMNEHDRICILLTNKSIAKENIISFINELLDICLKMRKYASYMQGWEILVKFVSQNFNNFNNTDFLKFIDALGTVIIPNESFWKSVANNMLSRGLKADEFVKVLLIVSKYKQEKSFYEKVCENVKEYKLFYDSKSSEAQKNDNQEALNLSNSLVLLYTLSQNLVQESFYNDVNRNLKSFVDEFIVKKTLALLVTENILDKLSKKDLVVLLRICGYVFNFKAFKDSISTKPLDDFIQQIILFINKNKDDNKNQNLIVMLFLMLKNIEYLYEKNEKIFENIILIIAENYRASNDLLKYTFYLELLEICVSNQNLNKILTEKSIKSGSNSENLFMIKQLVIPNEEFLDHYVKMNQQLKNETLIQNINKIKQDFFKKHYREIGIPKDKVDEYTKNNYAVMNSLNNIFG